MFEDHLAAHLTRTSCAWPTSSRPPSNSANSWPPARDAFDADWTRQRAAERLLEIIGEASNALVRGFQEGAFRRVVAAHHQPSPPDRTPLPPGRHGPTVDHCHRRHPETPRRALGAIVPGTRTGSQGPRAGGLGNPPGNHGRRRRPDRSRSGKVFEVRPPIGQRTITARSTRGRSVRLVDQGAKAVGGVVVADQYRERLKERRYTRL